MSEVNIEKWVTVKEVQSYLGVGRETVLHPKKCREICVLKSKAGAV